MFRFEKLNLENIHLLPALFEDAFGEKREINQILNKYSLEKVCSTYVSFLAFSEESNELAGFYGVLPAEFNYEGKIYLSAQICDLMTHSNYRRLGLFELMANHAHDFLRKNGFKFVYTFPYDGAISYFGFVNKLDFKEKSMNSYALKVPVFPFSRKIQNSFLHKLYTFYLYILFRLFIGNRLDNKNHFVEDLNDYKLRHDSYLYRYKGLLSKINFFISNKSINSFMKIDKDGALSIGNIQVESAREFNLHILKLKIFCFLGFIRYVHFEVCSTNYLNQFLMKKVNSKNLYTICYLIFDESIDINKIEFNFIDIDSF